jgi:hypothetical protein
MVRSGIERILTLNDGDFRRYAGEGVKVIMPESLIDVRS